MTKKIEQIKQSLPLLSPESLYCAMEALEWQEDRILEGSYVLDDPVEYVSVMRTARLELVEYYESVERLIGGKLENLPRSTSKYFEDLRLNLKRVVKEICS
jgi:hypothetical protein